MEAWKRLTLAFCASLLVAAPTAGWSAETRGETLHVQTLRGETYRADSVTLSSEGILTLAGKENDPAPDLTLADVLAIRFPAHRPAAPADNRVTVELRDGDRVAGIIRSGDEFNLELETVAGATKIPLENIAAVRFPALRELGRAAAGREASADADILLRSTSKGIDVVEGTLLSFEPDQLVFSGPVGDYPFRYEEVAAVLLMQLGNESEAATSAKAQVDLVDGARLSGSLVALDASKVIVESDVLGRLEIPARTVSAVGFRNDRFTHLSELDPVEVQETPYFGEDADFLFGWKRDRTVTGGELQVAGTSFQKGLGVHSRSSLTYEIDDSATSFHALVGVSDEVLAIPADGRLIFRVLVDGKTAFESPLLEAGDPAVPVTGVTLEGASRLTLEVDFGDASDAGDRAVWGNPVVVRGGTSASE